MTNEITVLAKRVVDLLSMLPVQWVQAEPANRGVRDPDVRAEELAFLGRFLPGTDSEYVSRSLAVARASAVAASEDAKSATLEWICRYVANFFGEHGAWTDGSAEVLAVHAFDGQRHWAHRWHRELLDIAYELRIADAARRTENIRGEF